MKIEICIGSSCHLKGSRQVIEAMKDEVQKRGLSDQVELMGKFCMGNCQHGVSVMMDGQIFSVQPSGVSDFFDKEVAKRL